MSEPLFRFSLLRPPLKQDFLTPSIALFQSSTFQDDMRAKGANSDDPHAAWVDASRRFVLKDPNFVGDPAVDPSKLVFKMMLLGRSIDDLENNERLDPQLVAGFVKTQMGQEYSSLVKSSEWNPLKSNLRDSLLAIKITHQGPCDDVAAILRDMELIENLATVLQQQNSTNRDNTFFRYRKRSFLFPQEFRAKPQVTPGKFQEGRNGITTERPPQHQELISLLARRQELSAATVEIRKKLVDSRSVNGMKTALHVDQPDGLLTEDAIGGPILEFHGLDIASTSTNVVLAQLGEAITTITSSLLRAVAQVEKYTVRQLGSTTIAERLPGSDSLRTLILSGTAGEADVEPILAKLQTLDAAGATAKGSVLTGYMADLVVVRQQLKKYEAADISSIQNIMKGELRKQEHSSTRKIEDTIFSETENTLSTENENSTASRYELGQESSATIKEDLLAKGTVNATAYGPMYTVSASLEGSASRSKEAVNQNASKYSREILDRTVKKITERVLQRHSTTITTEVVDKDSREFNNVGSGNTNISGVYTYLNKVYEAQCWNYGARLMFEIMVPEPAAVLLTAMTQVAQNPSVIKPPPEFLIPIKDISLDNYEHFSLLYQATKVSPPPSEQINLSVYTGKEGKNQGKEVSKMATGEITIPAGYEATSARVAVMTNSVDEDERVSVDVGGECDTLVQRGNDVRDLTLYNVRGSITWAVQAWDLGGFTCTIDIKCLRTADKFHEWQQLTHDKIMEAYQEKMREYEEKIAKAQVEAGSAIVESRSAEANQRTIREELRKHCISIITRKPFEDSGAIVEGTGANALPEFDFVKAEAQGAYARFFEQAFEWEQMAYANYGYYWGRRSRWASSLKSDDPDQAFNDFLKAGMARVVLPARPGFENAINHFLEHGELWKGGPLPAIAGADFLPIADELMASMRQFAGTEKPQGAPFEVRVPTSLVQLRSTAALPTWTKQADGNWVVTS